MRLLVTLALLSSVSAQFYQNRNKETPFVNSIQAAPYEGGNSVSDGDVDAAGIIGPIMTPFVKMFDIAQQNMKARQYAEKVEKEREENPLSSSKSIYELFQRLSKTTTTTTTPEPSLAEKLFKPYLEPFQKQLDSFSKEMAGITLFPTSTTTTTTTTTTPAPPPPPEKSLLEKSLGMFFPSLRRSPARDALQTAVEPPQPKQAKLFDPDFLDRVLFAARNKREAPASAAGFGAFMPPPPPIFAEWEKPLINNVFTPDPIQSIFTTRTPFRMPELPSGPKAQPVFDPKMKPLEAHFKPQDPFYNPLLPGRKNKLFDALFGDNQVKLLG